VDYVLFLHQSHVLLELVRPTGIRCGVRAGSVAVSLVEQSGVIVIRTTWTLRDDQINTCTQMYN
jgi:hypothetical protein